MSQINEQIAMCACRHVEYRNNDTNGLVTREWWECRDCHTIFVKARQREEIADLRRQLEVEKRKASDFEQELERHATDRVNQRKELAEAQQTRERAERRLAELDQPIKGILAGNPIELPLGVVLHNLALAAEAERDRANELLRRALPYCKTTAGAAYDEALNAAISAHLEPNTAGVEGRVGE